jgi:hypothetical protein
VRLADLLDRITKDNLHAEAATEEPRGEEVW